MLGLVRFKHFLGERIVRMSDVLREFLEEGGLDLERVYRLKRDLEYLIANPEKLAQLSGGARSNVNPSFEQN